MPSYAIFAFGMIADMAGFGIGLALLFPGGLFEVALAVWLIARGFAKTRAKSGAPA